MYIVHIKRMLNLWFFAWQNCYNLRFIIKRGFGMDRVGLLFRYYQSISDVDRDLVFSSAEALANNPCHPPVLRLVPPSPLLLDSGDASTIPRKAISSLGR